MISDIDELRFASLRDSFFLCKSIICKLNDHPLQNWQFVFYIEDERKRKRLKREGKPKDGELYFRCTLKSGLKYHCIQFTSWFTQLHFSHIYISCTRAHLHKRIRNLYLISVVLHRMLHSNSSKLHSI